MWWLWGSIAVVLALLFVGSWFYDRRHKGSTFGDGLETSRHRQDASNDQRSWGSGGGGFGGGG